MVMVVWIPSSLFLLSLLTVAFAVKFDLEAEYSPKPKWYIIAWYLPHLQLTTDSAYGILHLLIPSSSSQPTSQPHLIRGLAVTTHESADVGVCMTNWYLGHGNPRVVRPVELDVDIGADAIDYNAIANQESLSILEVEMRKLEAVAKGIVEEMGYLQRREMKMRDTNESTNERVKFFSILIICGTIGLGVWQLVHLRSFFKRKYLID
ncbi:hypothetical protein L204_104662 [Cryptococcus depauperatus]